MHFTDIQEEPASSLKDIKSNSSHSVNFIFMKNEKQRENIRLETQLSDVTPD